MTALGTTRVDHCTAATGLHAHAETMGALAAGNGRLIGTFHFLLPLLMVGLKKAQKKPHIRRFYPPLCQGLPPLIACG